MKMKKMLALLTAICLLFGLALNVFAASATYVSDFTDLTPGEGIPEGWGLAVEENPLDVGRTTVSVGPDPDDSSNQVMIMTQGDKKRNNTYYLLYEIDPTNCRTTLEYRYRVSVATAKGYLIMPSLVYESGKQVLVIMDDAGVVKYSNTTSDWISTGVTLEIDKWHTVKQVVDITNQTVELYLDGTEVALDSSKFNFSDELTKLAGVKYGFSTMAYPVTGYLDDLNVSVTLPDDAPVSVATQEELLAALIEGKTNITLTQKINVTGELTVAAPSPATITTGSIANAFTVDAGGVLTLGENISLNCVSNALLVCNGGKLVIDGAAITQSGEDTVPVTATGTGSVIEMKAGSVTAESSAAITALDGSVVNVRGGTVTNGAADKAALVAAQSAEGTGGTVNVSGGTVEGVLAHEAATAAATISGGIITGPVSTANEAKLTISGGTFLAEPDSEYLADGYELTTSTDANGDAVYGVKAVFVSDFEGLTPGKGIPEGWRHPRGLNLSKTSVSVGADPANESNQVMILTQTGSRNSWYELLYEFAPTSELLTLEYRYKVSSDATETLYLPSFVYSGTEGNTWPLVLRAYGNTLKYRNNIGGSGWLNAHTDLAMDQWHTIKHVVDIAGKTCQLYVDGTEIELDSSKFNFSDDLTQIYGITYGFENAAVATTAYLDDVKIIVGAVSADDGINTEAELKAAIAGGNNLIMITDDITLTEKITVTSAVKLMAEENVTITTGSVADAFTVSENGVLTLTDNIAVDCVQGAFRVEKGGKLVIDGAAIIQSGGDHVPVTATGTGSVIEMNSGSVVSEGSSAFAALDSSVVNINGGTVTSSQTFAAYAAGGATVNVSGGTVTNGTADKPALVAAMSTESTGGNVNVTGGIVKGVLAHEAATAKATISGGIITGSVSAANEAKLAISGGTFLAEPDSQYLADGYKIAVFNTNAGNPVYGAIAVNTAYDILDFEDEAADTELPDGWILLKTQETADRKKTTISVVADPDNADNHVMLMSQQKSRNSWYAIKYNFEATRAPVALEYRFRIASGATNDVFLPSLVYAGTTNTYPLLLRVKSGIVGYSNSNAKAAKWTDVDTMKMKDDQWHTVKLVVDISNKLCELYLDGVRIELDSSKFTFTDELTQIDSVVFGCRNTAIGVAAYVDDLTIPLCKPCESVTFRETETTIPAGAAQYLEPVFSPVTSSVEFTYSSDDESIVTVDALGKIFGVKEGEATITATPVEEGMDPIQIKVTVGAGIEGTITVSNDALALPVGGHEYLDASIVFEGNFIVDDTLNYASSAPDVATVDAHGEVLAIGAGTAVITISSDANPAIKETVTVTVTEPKVMRTIYVAPNGTGNGSSAASPTTLEGAAELLAAIDKTQLTGNIEVILAGGYYYRTTPLALTDAHGGNDRYTVIFKAAEGETPTIGGGLSIDGSKFKDTDNDGIYEYSLKELNLGDSFNTRQLYVDNVRAIRAKSEEVHAQKTTVLKNAEYLYDTDGTTPIGFLCDNEELLAVQRPQDLDFVYKINWVSSRCPVESIEQTEDGRVKVIMQQPTFSENINRSDFCIIMPSNVTSYENDLSLLDARGEWYYNKETQMLYYMPRLWENMDTVKVTLPVFDNWDKTDAGNYGLVTILGTSFEQRVQNIRFEGITFADTTWTRPDTKGLPHVQNTYITGITGNKYTQMPPDAAVTVKMANSVDFLDCVFTRLGSNGINLYDGVHNSLIEGCRFYDISAGAVCIGHPSYTEDNYNPKNVIERMKNVDALNNYIHDIGVDYLSSSAISMGYAEDVDLCNNEIFNAPYSAFHIGYGWDKTFTTYTRNINVSRNFIHDYMYGGLRDGGGIYTNGATGGDEEHWNIQSENYLRNQGASTAALYADSGTAWWKAYKNVVDVSEHFKNAISNPAWARRNAGHHNETFDNYHAGRDSNWPDKEDKHIYYYNNTAVEDTNGDGTLDWNAEALAIIAASGLEEAYDQLRNNHIERIYTDAPDAGIELSAVEPYNKFNLNIKFTDGKETLIADTSNATIVYESLDEKVVTVDENGVITYVGDGQTTVRIHVVSNNIWKVVEHTVYAGDEVASLHLKNRESGVIDLGETTGYEDLVAYGITETGRQVTFDTVTWSIADETVATVDASGRITPVAVGKTVLTVVGKKSNVELTVAYPVTVREGAGFAVDYLEDLFQAKNAEHWYAGSTNGTWELTKGERITAQVDGDRTYYGRKFESELLTFRLRLDPVGTWPSLVLRASANDACIGDGGTGYIISLTESGIQLQRFNGSKSTVLYGTIAGNTPKYGPDIPHSKYTDVVGGMFSDKQFHEVQIGAANEAAGVRLVMYIDGIEIFNCVDSWEGAITDSGYFGLVGDGNATENSYDGFTLENMNPSVEEEIEIKHNLTLESDIDFSFFVPKSDVAESGLTATVIQDRATGFEDKTVTLDQANWESYAGEDGIEYWRIRYADVAAKEMTDKLTLVLRDASGVLFTDSYSVAEYAKERIENSTNENMKNLMNIMLHYGAAAQVYFDYKTDDLANAGLAAASTASFRAAANAVSTVKHNLTLESNINFSFFVPKSDVAASGLTATILHDRIEGYDDKRISLAQAEWETLTSGGVEYWRIRYTDVAAKEIADSLTLTVTDGTNTVVTDSYSVLQYAQERVQNSSNENMKTLMQMLQAYGAAARLYFGYTAN